MYDMYDMYDMYMTLTITCIPNSVNTQPNILRHGLHICSIFSSQFPHEPSFEDAHRAVSTSVLVASTRTSCAAVCPGPPISCYWGSSGLGIPNGT